MEMDRVFKEYKNIFNQIRYNLLLEYCEEKRNLIEKDESTIKVDELKYKYEILLQENIDRLKDMNEKLLLITENEFKKGVLR